MNTTFFENMVEKIVEKHIKIKIDIISSKVQYSGSFRLSDALYYVLVLLLAPCHFLTSIYWASSEKAMARSKQKEYVCNIQFYNLTSCYSQLSVNFF